MALEWAPGGVQVNAVAPGYFPDAVTSGEEGYAERVQSAKTTVPLGRVGRLREVGLLCLYLAADASSFTTGSVLTVDGGAQWSMPGA